MQGRTYTQSLKMNDYTVDVPLTEQGDCPQQQLLCRRQLLTPPQQCALMQHAVQCFITCFALCHSFSKLPGVSSMPGACSQCTPPNPRQHHTSSRFRSGAAHCQSWHHRSFGFTYVILLLNMLLLLQRAARRLAAMRCQRAARCGFVSRRCRSPAWTSKARMLA